MSRRDVYICIRDRKVTDPIVFFRKEAACSYERHYHECGGRTLLLHVPWSVEDGEYGAAEVLEDRKGKSKKRRSP